MVEVNKILNFYNKVLKDNTIRTGSPFFLLFLLFLSQSYDIGKTNVKYALSSEVQVGQHSKMFTMNTGYKYKHFKLSFISLTIGQGFEAPCHCLFRVGLPGLPGEGS